MELSFEVYNLPSCSRDVVRVPHKVSIASPPTAWPCFYGVDTPNREKLLAARMSEEEMRDHLQVDSLRFISLDGLYRAVGEAKGRNAKAPQYCDACFSGAYPVEPSDMIEKGFTLKAAE